MQHSISCARCRRLKVKCIFEGDQCRRCLSARQPCEPAVSKRKLRKSSEQDRFAQLEATVAHLTSTLHQMQPEVIEPGMLSSQSPSLQPMSSEESPVWTTSSVSSIALVTETGLDDLITSGVVSQTKLYSLYETFQKTFIPGVSMFKLPEASFWEMYTKRPILLQAIITVAASDDASLHPLLYEKMKQRLLHEYFTKFTRNIDLIQSFLLNCEYVITTDQNISPPQYISQTWAPMATEAAFEAGLYEDRVREDQMYELEYERTLIWLYITHASVLCIQKRYPRRVLWTDHHEVSHRRLLNSEHRYLTRRTQMPRLMIELNEAESMIGNPAIMQSFQAKINALKIEFDMDPSPTGTIGINSLTLLVHEAHLRHASINPTQRAISLEICKSCAWSTLSLVTGYDGTIHGYPSLFCIKPLHGLMTICRLFKVLQRDETQWINEYVATYDSAIDRMIRDGSLLAQSASGKAREIIRWYHECDDITNDPTTSLTRWKSEQSTYEVFAELFGI